MREKHSLIVAVITVAALLSILLLYASYSGRNLVSSVYSRSYPSTTPLRQNTVTEPEHTKTNDYSQVPTFTLPKQETTTKPSPGITTVPTITLTSNHSGSLSINTSLDMAKAANSFGLRLAKKLLNGEENNVISPFSIYSALLALYEASSGQTKEELANTLRLPRNTTAVRNAYRSLTQRLKGGKGAAIKVANSLWLQRDLALVRETIDRLEKYYDAEILVVDFLHSPGKALDKINEWIKEKTKGRIKKILSNLSRATMVLIVNTLYFNATWITPFHEIGEKPFHVTSNKTVMAPMMSEDIYTGYYEDNLVKVVEIPYGNTDYIMLILLPKNTSLGKLLRLLDEDYLEYIRRNIIHSTISVTIPEFRAKSKYSQMLRETLKNMGLRNIFAPGKAELANLFKNYRKTSISNIVHQVFIDVNKYGTEATAATSIAVIPGSAPPKYSFYADHPFIYMIVHKSTGLVLFLGVLVNPTAD